MSTVKIKTEPTTTAAAVDVQVKLEPSLSTADIKLEQHTSDVDTKVESDSDTGSEEDDIKSENDDGIDDGEEDTNQSQRQFICEYSGCSHSYSQSGNLVMHQHEHRLQAELNIHGKTYTLTRQSLDGRWPCPFPDCTSTLKTIDGIRGHIRRCHGNTVRHQQPSTVKTRINLYFLEVDSFYVKDARCGYHTTIGLFICHKCRLVPECLLTHLQQKHGYDEKSIDNSTLPDSAVNAGADPSVNQHTSNTHLKSAISCPHWQQHPDIVHGWLCVTSDCGYCGYVTHNKTDHRTLFHQGEQLITVPALVLRLTSMRKHTSYFLITRIDQASGAVTTSQNRANWYKLNYNHNGLDSQDEIEDDVSQNENLKESDQKRQWKCEYPDCGSFFNSSDKLCKHRREHKLKTVLNILGTTFVPSRKSSDDRWPCPIPDCQSTYQKVDAISKHIQTAHRMSMKQKYADSEDDNNEQHQIVKKKRCTFQYLQVDDFYVRGIKCGYHRMTGVFICHECRLVPECLLTHMQQKHGYDEKSIDNSALPESAVNASADLNINQHTSNSLLALAIREPCQRQHPDIVQGWLCTAPDCGYSCITKIYKRIHQYKRHKGEQQLTAPALVLRLFYAKTQASCLLITRLDTIINNVKPSELIGQQNSECDDGDELVLSDMGDDSDIH